MLKTSFGFLAALIMAAPLSSAQAALMSFSGHFSNDTPTPMPNPACMAGQVFVSFNPDNSTAQGTSNFGDFGPSQSHCIAPGQPYAGTFDFVFDLGDMFSGTTAGYMTPTATPLLFNSFVTYTVTGGTGRFAGATGTIKGVGLLDRAPMRPVNDLNLSGSLNIAAVPEPASWAMMVIGFGAAGAALRRRRPSHAGLTPTG